MPSTLPPCPACESTAVAYTLDNQGVYSDIRCNRCGLFTPFERVWRDLAELRSGHDPWAERAEAEKVDYHRSEARRDD